MKECSVEDIDRINYFLDKMNQKAISDDDFISNITKYVIIDKIGFIAYSIYYERAEIDYIYVEEEFRNNGYGFKLLTYVIDKNSDLDNFTLEVDVNNKSAINLYRKCGFAIATTRKKYYGSNDAYLMIRR